MVVYDVADSDEQHAQENSVPKLLRKKERRHSE
jgi:hypothetical protein